MNGDSEITIDEAIAVGEVLKHIAESRGEEEAVKDIELELALLNNRKKKGKVKTDVYMTAKRYGRLFKFFNK